MSPRKIQIQNQINLQVSDILLNKKNKNYFAEVCLDILNILLDNVQKSQLLEKDETYFEFISNFLFRN